MAAEISEVENGVCVFVGGLWIQMWSWRRTGGGWRIVTKGLFEVVGGRRASAEVGGETLH